MASALSRLACLTVELMSPSVYPRLWRPRRRRGSAPGYIPPTPHPSPAKALGRPDRLAPPQNRMASLPLPPALLNSPPPPPHHRTCRRSTGNWKRVRPRSRWMWEEFPRQNRTRKKLRPQVITVRSSGHKSSLCCTMFLCSFLPTVLCDLEQQGNGLKYAGISWH